MPRSRRRATETPEQRAARLTLVLSTWFALWDARCTACIQAAGTGVILAAAAPSGAADHQQGLPFTAPKDDAGMQLRREALCAADVGPGEDGPVSEVLPRLSLLCRAARLWGGSYNRHTGVLRGCHLGTGRGTVATVPRASSLRRKDWQEFVL